MDLLNVGILLAIILCLIILSWIWPPDSPWAPWWRTRSGVARVAFKLAKVGKKDIVYELGSGEATALIIAAQEFGAKGVGIEIEPFRFLLSKFTVWQKGLNKQITLKRGNFFDENLSEATAIFVYLVPKTLDRLIPKFKKELKKVTRIISYHYEMNLPLKNKDAKNNIFLYII